MPPLSREMLEQLFALLVIYPPLGVLYPTPLAMVN